jgi:hypothetical protein
MRQIYESSLRADRACVVHVWGMCGASVGQVWGRCGVQVAVGVAVSFLRRIPEFSPSYLGPDTDCIILTSVPEDKCEGSG